MPFAIAAFVQNGVPQLGLSSTINIRRVSDNFLEVSASAMSEIGDGFYKFDFTTGLGFVVGVEYVFRADGGVALGPSQFFFGTSLVDAAEVTEAVWDEPLASHLTAGSTGQAHSRILAFAAQDNVMLDGGPNAAAAAIPDYDAAGLMLEGRMRAFDTAVNRAAATAGNVAVETGELYRQLISATSVTPGQASSYTSDRDL